MSNLIFEMVKTQKQLNEMMISKGEPINHQDFLVALIVEFIEFVDSLPWKWWTSKKTIDTWNLKIETVDIAHFYFSYVLSTVDNDVERAAEIVKQQLKFDETIKCDNGSCIRKYAYDLLTNIKPHEILNFCINYTQLDLTTFAKIYFLKVALNKLRTNYQPSYTRNWNGQEDNQYLQHLLDLDITSVDDAYKELEKVYREL